MTSLQKSQTQGIPQQQQLELFQINLPKNLANWSRAFTSVDILPWYISTTKNKLTTLKQESKTINLSFNGKKASVTITPASLIERKGTEGRYPSPLDDLVMKAIRYHQATGQTLFWDEQTQRFKHYFTLYAISTILREWGYKVSTNQIRRSLDIYAGANFIIQADFIDGLDRTKRYTRISYERIGNQWQITLNDLEAKSVLNNESYLAVNARRIMAFKNPLARRLAELVSLYYRNATKEGRRADPAFSLTFNQLGAAAAMQNQTPRKLRREIQTALAFLKQQGFLRDFKLEPIADLTQPPKPGRKVPADTLIHLWLSDRDAEDIVRANIERDKRRHNLGQRSYALTPSFPTNLLEQT